MCTVSWIYDNENFICTSNRDEHISRQSATFPAQVEMNGIQLSFPQDQPAGGTWFAINNIGHLGVLLNGAFNSHFHEPPYARSRGLILLEIMEHQFPVRHFDEMSLKNIEPFTIITQHQDSLSELRWDGIQKYNKELDVKGLHIWSSATLYDKEVILHREKFFEKFIEDTSNFTEEKILAFHQYNHGDSQNGFVIDRGDGLKTVSITQAVMRGASTRLTYKDMDTLSISSIEVNNNLSIVL